MDFSLNWRDGTPALLPQGSRPVLTGPSGGKWQHGIQPNRNKTGPSDSRRRRRRISLTFRTVLDRDGVNP